MYATNKIETFHPAHGRGYEPSRTLLIFCLLITALLCLTAASNTANATDYYLDAVSGNDSWDGLAPEWDGTHGPWKTMSKAKSTVQASDIVLLRDGNYGSVTFGSSDNTGTSWSNKITYKADAGHNPVFSKLDFLGTTNDWYLEFNGITINVPDTSAGIYLKTNVAHLRLLNLTIQGMSTWEWGESPPRSDHGILFGPWSGGSFSNTFTDILIDGCEISWFSRAILIVEGVEDVVVSNNNFHSNGGTIIKIHVLSVGNLLIDGNHLHHQVQWGTQHGSGIRLNSSNVTIRNNIIHDTGNSYGIGFYDNPGGGFQNVLIENNLIYDIYNTANGAISILRHSDNIVVRNNTLIGQSFDEYHDPRSGRGLYGNTMRVTNAIYGSGGLEIYNNVIVGTLLYADGASHEAASGNIMWSHYDNGVWQSELPGNIIVNPGNSSEPEYFEPAGNFFVGPLDFNERHGLNLNDSFKLAPTSPAIGFADPAHATATDIFGNPRYGLPDAGCYEYVPLGNQAPQVTGSDPASGSSVSSLDSLVVYLWDDVDVDEAGTTITATKDGAPFTGFSRDNSVDDQITLNITPEGDGVYRVTVTPLDNEGLAGTTVTIEITLDTVYPLIADIQATNITSSGATITWTTNEPATSQVEYGLNTNYGNSISDPTLVTSHTLTPTGLEAGTLYHYRVISADASGNKSTSQDNTFTTSGASTYSIIASAGSGGQIIPSGTTQVVSGGSQTYTITANAGYHIVDVLVDGSSVGPVTSYPFTNVTANHTIDATFAVNTTYYTITASAGNGGQISPSGTTQVVSGGSQTYTITANTGYHIVDVLVDGSSVGPVTSYPFTNVTANHTIDATFAVNTTYYTITASAGNGGQISPSGNTQVNEGENQTFTITADTGYHISDVLVDGSSVGPVTSYPFTNVTANHTIDATFAIGEEDVTAPTVTILSPRADWQANLNTLVTLDITDSGDGVDANSVTVNVNNNLVYSGNTNHYPSADGDCRRSGTKARYIFIYQSKEMFDFDQSITVTVDADDLAGNNMDPCSYSFDTEMRSFGEKKTLTAGKEIISSGANKDSERPLTTVSDSSGNVWVAWTEGDKGPNNSLINRDIWIGKLTVGAESFESGNIRQVTNDHDQSNPVLAIDSSDMLYLVWQDERNGKWDLFISTSADGKDWTMEELVTDSRYNQTNPAMAIDSSDEVYIVYDDDQNTDKDIYIASSADNYVSKTQITSAGTGAVYDQTTPDIAIDSADTVYVVWADARNWNGEGEIKYDIYGAASNSWTNNIEIVDKAKDGQQTAPKVATEDSGTILHFVWVDDEPGDKEVYYDSSNGLPGTPLTGTNIIDQDLPNLSNGKQPEQKQPAIAVTGYTGNDLKVFACWEDERYNKIENIHAVEMTNLGTNIWVGDDGAGNDQKVPAIGIDPDNHPYLVWVNNKSDIIYSGSTFIESELASTNVSITSEATVGTTWNAIQSIDDVSVEIPAGAYLVDIKVTISRIRNPQKFPMNNRTFLYEFGPSGTTFSEPVTITIPYNATTLFSSSSAYWYNPLYGYSQEGITDVEVIQISSGLYALRFKTTHFSIFGGGGLFDGGGGGGGGGCSMSPNSQGSIVELLLPYIGLAVAMVVLKLRDRRKRKAHNIAKS